MITRNIAIVLGLVFCSLAAFGQPGSAEDPVLFTVNDRPVLVSEFNYIYTKTNGEEADFSEASLEEYLNLYTKFKLKVEKARDMQLDTIPALQQELEGYRRQLADSYLIDREVTERLLREVYDRQSQDVDISHILIPVPTSNLDTSIAYNLALSALEDLNKGLTFADVAQRYSKDKSVAQNKGHIGFVSAMFPNGLYALETAAYSAPIGKPVGPIRTTAGYHVLVVHSRRPARGEVEVAHILIRTPEEGITTDPKVTIDSIYQVLMAGGDFDALARELSGDKMTAGRGGYIGIFGINKYEKAFEDASFALENPGDYSKPFKTTAGWHIVKLISKKELGPYNQAKGGIQAKVKRDQRFEEAKEAMIKRIRKENNFLEFNTTLNAFIPTLGEDFLTFRWKATGEKSEELLFAFGNNYKVTLGDFTTYLENSSRDRIRMARTATPESAVRDLYQQYVDEKALEFEEKQLAQKYPEFKALMREYEEGILLFEATKMLVWDKAAQDTSGLIAYYESVKGRYTWRERAVVSTYSIKSVNAKTLKKVKKYIRKHNPDEVMAKYNTDPENPMIIHSERTYEEERARVLDNMEWKAGAISEFEMNEREGTASCFKIEKILPEQGKTLDEARGYIIADYQDHLERKWVNELKKEYPVVINTPVFKSLIKK
ncbi:MAG: peptidylprolyl isomerase [Saprospiraceae bacterium]|nr:peptidylprolyl isomerase [Saprospiraceae bacterium]